VREPSTASVVTTCAPSSDRVSLTASSSVDTSNVLSDILKLPQHSIKKTNRKPGFNKQAICITDEKVMKELEEKAKEKK